MVGDIVINHADVGALVSAGPAHRIGEELAADPHRVTARLAAFDQRLDVFVRHTRLDKDGGNLPLDEEVHELVDVRHAGLGFRADALDAAHVNVVGAAKIVEGVMRGDQHPACLRDAGDGLLRVSH